MPFITVEAWEHGPKRTLVAVPVREARKVAKHIRFANFDGGFNYAFCEPGLLLTLRGAFVLRKQES